MASREDWNALRRDHQDDDEFDEAIDNLDRDFEHSQYYEAQRAVNEFSGHNIPDKDDLDTRHAYADLQEAKRAKCCE